MEKSFVGDPVLWPGLVYSPLNNFGLLFALGTVAEFLGLLFEEFSVDARTAICRRRTERGWERLRVGFAVRSSERDWESDEIDLLICWVDDAPGGVPERLAIADLSRSEPAPAHQASKHRGLDSILPETAATDLLERARNRESYQATVRQLDEQIKKLQNG
jgi:hypothetical protein